jgi:uncharacterized protein (DUF433 family)
MLLTRITFDPQKEEGKPYIRELQIPVATVISMFAEGMRDQEVLNAFPGLEKEDIQEALYYAAQAIQYNGENQEILQKISRKKKFALSLSQLPYVSDEEQKDIEEYMEVSPNFDRDDYIDMTAWVNNEANLE